MEENKEKELDEEVINESIDEAVDNSVEPCGDEAEEVTNENKELTEAKAKANEYLDKYQRLMAEFYNFRERTSKEKAKQIIKTKKMSAKEDGIFLCLMIFLKTKHVLGTRPHLKVSPVKSKDMKMP